MPYVMTLFFFYQYDFKIVFLFFKAILLKKFANICIKLQRSCLHGDSV